MAPRRVGSFARRCAGLLPRSALPAPVVHAAGAGGAAAAALSAPLVRDEDGDDANDFLVLDGRGRRCRPR